MALDLNKPVMTRDGRKVRILCTDKAGGSYPIVGLVTNFGSEDAYSWTSDGRFLGETDERTDLVNVPPPKKTVQVEVRMLRDPKTGEIFCGSRMLNIPDERFRGELQTLASTTITMEYEVQA